ncbi:peroxidase [Ectothiorhodospira haloalkaliphila]|uniref:Peroxidase n=2 Tax=Ectothiorhodospiraceae TaxID=72276 RepID=W8KI25_9GAMM|nr:peroxidase [Ectothiorhodospira haloalkaliphila]
MHGEYLRGHCPQKGVFGQAGRFGRMFPHLRSLKESHLPQPAQPHALGAADGPMKDDLGEEGDNPGIPAGFTFFGQFVDHDITFDPTSSLESQNDPQALRNFRTPMLELDSLYGAGPAAQPYLYDGVGRFLTSAEGDHDLLRNHRGTAVIGDPRNDENLIVSQLHLAFARFHNHVFDEEAGRDFEEAQRLVRWHYQWIVLHDYLPRICGQARVDDILDNGRRYYWFAEEPYMPVEFSVAAFRFGHSQVRAGYRINATAGGARLFPAEADAPRDGGLSDLRGGVPVAREHTVDWSGFLGEGEGVQPSRLINTRLNESLLFLPDSVVPAGVPDEARSLATRNLKRGAAFSLPSGQSVAACMGADVLNQEELWGQVPGLPTPLPVPAPLWYYILREAEVREAGQHLGEVGGQIVAEVLIGLLEGDRASFVNHAPHWRPTLPSKEEGHFTLEDLVNIAQHSHQSQAAA